jgi:glutamate:GABA antiporter
MPFHRPLTVIQMALVAVATIQLIAPGPGSHWFGSDFAPEDRTYAQRFTYLWTELIPVLCFAAIGTLFWWTGRRVRAQAARAEAAGARGTAPAD